MSNNAIDPIQTSNACMRFLLFTPSFYCTGLDTISLSGSAQTNNQCVKVNNSLQKNVATAVLYTRSVAESRTRMSF